MTSIPAYAVAYLRNVDVCDDIIRYMREIDSTLAPFDGEFIIHGGDMRVLEGDGLKGDGLKGDVPDGALVVIRFPDMESASGWYYSQAYRRILPWRVEHADSITALVPGVAPGHTGEKRAAELLAEKASTTNVT
ncbi:MAG: hypothetical protein K0R68_1592 [Mycobacterium sp.]|nr:hypothetical protein [Mycobacterium sp.]